MSIIEMAVYTIKEESLRDFPNLNAQIVEKVRQLNGSRGFQTFKSNTKEQLIMDFCLWENQSLAEEAQQKVMQDHECERFFASINEMKSFDHWKIIAEVQSGQSILSVNKPVIELSMFKLLPQKQKEFAETQIPLFEALKKMPGFQSLLRLQSTKDALLYADVLRWTTLESVQSAMTLIKEFAVCNQFMQCVKEDLIFDTFSPYSHL